MDVLLFLCDGVVHIPTSYRVDRARFFVEDAPLESVPVGQIQRLQQAIFAAIERGNPPISSDDARNRLDGEDDALLKATGARSWNVLDRRMKGLWSIADIDGRYRIRVKCPMQPRGWHEDQAKSVQFPPGTPIDDVITHVIAMIQERSRE